MAMPTCTPAHAAVRIQPRRQLDPAPRRGIASTAAGSAQEGQRRFNAADGDCLEANGRLVDNRKASSSVAYAPPPAGAQAPTGCQGEEQ